MTTRRSFFAVMAGVLAAPAAEPQKSTARSTSMTLVYRGGPPKPGCTGCGATVLRNEFCGKCRGALSDTGRLVKRYGWHGAAKIVCGCNDCMAMNPCASFWIHAARVERVGAA